MRIVICTMLFLAAAFAGSASYAQDKKTGKREGTTRDRLPDTANNPGFRDDSTDASTGFSPLSGTPGTATTSGTGGLGTVKETAPIGTDIYTIEHRDSVKRAKEDSVRKAKAGSKPRR